MKETSNKFKQDMISYYDERAKEYDEVYLGKGPSIPNPLAYKNDVEKIKEIVIRFGKGHLIDIGGGTGFWLPYYEQNCSKITLLDRSEKMLSECRRRISGLGLENKCHFIQGDFFKVKMGDSIFDSANAGFFISHLSLDEEEYFFKKLKRILKKDAKVMIIDSAWSKKRKQYRKKEGMQERVLNDGRKFTIYKRYFDRGDIEKMFKEYLFKLESLYMGDMFLVAVGENQVGETENTDNSTSQVEI